MLNWLFNLIPAEYKWDVASKKAAYMAGKLTVGLVLGSKVGPYVSGHLSPDQLSTLQTGITIASATLLEALHDWLKVKYPNANWL